MWMVGAEFGINMKVMIHSVLYQWFRMVVGVMMWGMFSLHILTLLPTDCHFNATAYLSIVADHVDPFMTNVYPSSDG